MASEAPPFWWDRPDWRAAVLWPVSAVYGAVAARKLERARRERVGVPVLCVGNPTVGGAGKTPVALALARQAEAMGYRPGFLSRGHGGSLTAPHIVDPHRDSAKHTGDEPLLLARQAPTAASPNRAAAARLLIGEGCDFLIMDDGFQSARIHQDLAVLVVDARRGVGNGHVIPGGPVRAPLLAQLRHADALISMGVGDGADQIVRMASRAGLPIYRASTRPRAATAVQGRRLVAFAGIGDPRKFFDTVRGAGGEIAVAKPFADHHFYTDRDLQELLALAEQEGAELVTTEKDAVRIRHSSPLAETMLAVLHVIAIDVEFELEDVPARLVRETAAAFTG